MSDIPVVGPDGKDYLVDSSELDSAQFYGYKPKGGAFESIQGAGRAAALGLLGGVTGGLSDAALAGAVPGGTEGDQETTLRPELQQTYAEHPVTHFIGEAAGMLASPINKVAAPIEEAIGAQTVLRRIGGKALGGAAVGSLFGAGQTISESALGDSELTAQRLLAGMGLGSVLGLVGGGVGGALEEGLGAARKALGKALLKAPDELDAFADSRWNKAGGAIKSDLSKLSPEQRTATADVFRKHIPGDGDLSDAFESMAKEQQAVGQEIGAIAGAPDTLGKKMAQFDGPAFLKDLNARERRIIAPEVDNLVKDLAQNELDGGGFKGAHEIVGDLGKQANWKYAPDSDPIKNGLMKDLYSSAREHLESQLGVSLDPALQSQFVDASQRYSNLMRAMNITRNGLDRMDGNSWFSLRDRLGSLAGAHIGGAIGGPVGTGVGYLASGLISKVVRERGSAVIARLADRIMASPVLETVAKSFAESVAKTPSLLGDYGPVIALAAGNSPAHALATHMVLATENPDYQQQAKVAGIAPETPQQTEDALLKAHGLATIQAHLMAHDAEMESHAQKAVKGGAVPTPPTKALNTQDFGAKRMRREADAAYQQRMSEVEAMANSPEQLAERIAANTAPVARVAPMVAAGMAKSAQAAIQHLSQFTARPPPTPLGRDWVYPDAQKHAFAQALGVIQDPKSVLGEIASGTLTKGHVDALRAYAPKLEQEMQAKVLNAVAERKDVPYSQRVLISLWTGTDLDGSTSPKAILANQQAIRGPSQKPSVQQQQQTATAHALDKLTLSERTATPTERRETAAE